MSPRGKKERAHESKRPRAHTGKNGIQVSLLAWARGFPGSWARGLVDPWARGSPGSWTQSERDEGTEMPEIQAVANHWGVFLDRDGTVTEEAGYVNHPSRLNLLPGAAEGIAAMQLQHTTVYALQQLHAATVASA